MKFQLLKTWVRLRRLLGHGRRIDEHARDRVALEKLMRRAQPFAAWTERAHWMVEVAAWLRAEPPVWSESDAALVCSHRRTRLMLDWLQADREAKKLVQATVQKTLREAVGPELFCGAGIAPRTGLLREAARALGRAILPHAVMPHDLGALLLAMFPAEKDERWLRCLDAGTRRRLWKLIADDGIGHGLQQQIDEALHFLVNAVLATGTGPEVRQRLGPRLPLRATPFMALRRELERFLVQPSSDESAMRSVRMLLAVCQAQTDKVYEHLDEHGVSVRLVFEIEQLRGRLTRMARLIDLRHAIHDDSAGHALQLFLAESVREHHRSATGNTLGRSFSLLARKVVERNADQPAHYMSRDRSQYAQALRAGCVGGAILPLLILGLLVMDVTDMSGFLHLLTEAGLFCGALISIGLLGGAFFARQSPVVAPLLAARIGQIDTLEGMRGLLKDSAALLRAQHAVAFGNLAVLLPALLIMSLVLSLQGGIDLLSPQSARQTIGSLSLLGPTPLLAVLTGVLCWLASLFAGLADNWFVLHRLRDAIAHHAGLRMWLGAARSQRLASWLARHVSPLAGGVALAGMFAALPALGGFFGTPLDLRHAVLSAGMLATALSVLDISAWREASTWLAVLGVLLALPLNILAAWSCSLLLALHSRNAGPRARRVVARSLLRRLRSAPLSFVLPNKGGSVAAQPQPVAARVEQARDAVRGQRTGTE